MYHLPEAHTIGRIIDTSINPDMIVNKMDLNVQQPPFQAQRARVPTEELTNHPFESTCKESVGR